MNSPVQTSENIAVLSLAGRLESHTVPELQERIMHAMNTLSPYLIIDLTDVSFIDSSGLVMFVQNMRRCREKGGDLFLCGLQQPVRMVLELTRLDKAIQIFPNQAEACAAFTE